MVVRFSVGFMWVRLVLLSSISVVCLVGSEVSEILLVLFWKCRLLLVVCMLILLVSMCILFGIVCWLVLVSCIGNGEIWDICLIRLL